MNLPPSTSSLPARFPPAAWSRRWGQGVRILDALQPVWLLVARLYVAQVFWRSGLTKLRDWDTTLLLFREEYRVPLLPPEAAAWMGTGGELVLPVLLAAGALGRPAALGLTLVNLVAVLSLSDIPEPALMLHVFWGSLLLALVVFGPGRLSIDALASRRRSSF